MVSLGSTTITNVREDQLRRVQPSTGLGLSHDESKPLLRGSWLARLAGTALLVAGSTASSIPIPPPLYDRRRQTATVVFFHIQRWRRVSLTQARQMALAALAEAENRRAAFAEQEAKLTTIWEAGA